MVPAVILLALCSLAAGQGYPACVEQDVVFRNAGVHAIFIDLSTYGTAGCWQNDCKHTDKFNAEDRGVCARACSAIDECSHWSFGEQEGVTKCFLRKSDGGRENVDGWASAAKACAPAPLPDAFVALAAANTPDLLVCDAGKSDACPDMGRAITTWKFAIKHLKLATEGALDANTMQFVHQIGSDTDAFAAQMSQENFPVVVNNNRQVINALRGWLEDQPKVEIDVNDASLPNPLRGKLCGTTSCY